MSNFPCDKRGKGDPIKGLHCQVAVLFSVQVLTGSVLTSWPHHVGPPQKGQFTLYYNVNMSFQMSILI